MLTVSAFGASGLWNLMNVSAFRATDRRHLMNVLSFGASALWKLMNISAFRTSGLWTLMNVSAVGFSGHWNLLNVSAFCLPCCLGLLPGGCCLGREMNRIPHALAMQAKKTQHSQPEELAMLAILFFTNNHVGIVGNRRIPT